MASPVKQTSFPRSFEWLDWLGALLARELAPNSRKIRAACRMATIGTVGGGLVVACHVYNELGLYLAWALVGAAGPMMSPRKAGALLIAQALVLALSVFMGRTLVEAPWLNVAFLFIFISFSTYLGTIYRLGAALILIQVSSLFVFYLVPFSPQEVGWFAAGAFGGSAIAFGVIVLFDNWLWPDPAETRLLESLAIAIRRTNLRLRRASNYYLNGHAAARPPLPPPTSDLPIQLTLLDHATDEGVSGYHHAILLTAITIVARIELEVDRFTVTVLERVPRQIRSLVQSELDAAVTAVAVALDDLARELAGRIAKGMDKLALPSLEQAKSALDALNARVLEVRPTYLRIAGSEEIVNISAILDSLASLTAYIERLLDQPLQPSSLPETSNSPRQSLAVTDSAILRYAVKVGLCVVIGYVTGLTTQRVELSTILITVVITALPTYGAALHKMVLRMVGALIGGAVSLIAIIIVSRNFETLPTYMLVLFVVFYFSAYSSLTSGRLSYAGNQIGTTFAIVVAGLGPTVDIYEPLWRIWGILLGCFVVALVFLLFFPEYAADSLLPRLRKAIRATLALTPEGSASYSEEQIQQTNSEVMSLVAEILEVANDAQVEGRACSVNYHAIVDAAGTLRAIASRFSVIASGRALVRLPQLDLATESARERALNGAQRQLETWLEFFSGPDCINASAAREIAQTHPPDVLAKPIDEFSSRLEENSYARTESWSFEQRRVMLAELQTMRRLEVLISDLNRYLAQIPGPSRSAAGSYKDRLVEREEIGGSDR
jgi:MFS family permease